MSKRLAILAATTALTAIASPAAAQDDYEAVADSALRAGQSWADEPQAGVSWDAEAPEAVAYEWESREVVQDYYEEDLYDDGGYEVETHDGADWDGPPPGYHTARRTMHRRGPHHAERSSAPRLAYTAAERDEWLAQCRSLHARQDSAVYYEDEDDADGGIIGAVTGGFAGNRIADGDRLLGTIVGAGVGGLAGAVIGSVIDGRDDDDDHVAYVEDEYGFDYCAAYLQNYERGYGVPGQMAYAPVMMIPVAQGPHHAERRTSYRVIEEEVEVDADRPARRHIRRATPARGQGKLTRTN